MPDITDPHDRFFRDSLGRRDLAADFCQHYLPAEVAATLNPDPAAWELVTERFVDEALGMHVADLLYLTRLIDGPEAYVYLVLEHKSAPDRFVALQLLRYMLQQWEKDRQDRPRQPLRPILPVVVYHGRRRWRVARTFAEIVRPPEAWRAYCPDFRYALADVSPNTPPPERGGTRLQVRLWVLRAAFGRDLVADLVEILTRLEHVAEIRLRARELDTILLYLGATPAGRKPPGVRQAAAAASRVRGDEMVNEWEMVREEWRAEGREEGLEKGLRNGIALALDLRFGAAGLALVPELAHVHDAAQLQALLDAMRDVASPDELEHRIRAMATHTSPA